MSESAAVKLAEELKNLLDELDEDTINELSADEIAEKRKQLNPYGRTIEGSDKILTFSFTNLTEKYIEKLLMTSLIAFMNRMVDEWHVPDGHPVIPVYDYINNPALLEEYHADWKKTDKIVQELEENREWMKKRVIVKEFLEEMFQYNPDVHVRSIYKPQPRDLERKIIDTPAANLAIDKLSARDLKFREQMIEFDRVQKIRQMRETHDEKDEFNNIAEKLVLPDRHYSTMDFNEWSDEDKNALRTACEFIPPADIYHRWRTYKETNYDKLREAVLYLYCDKPNFDMAINPYSWHSSDEEATAFQKKHKNEVIAEIFKAHSGRWNFFAPFAKVRESMKYFNEHTSVLEEIADHIEKDAKIGQELMKNRIKIKKKKNVEEEGPDSEYFRKWKEENTTLKDLGAETVNKDSYAADDCPEDAVQVDIWHVAAGTGKVKKTKMFTKAEAPTFAAANPE